MKTLLAMVAVLGLTSPALAAKGESGAAVNTAVKARPAKPDLAPSIPPYSLESRDFIFPSGLRVIMQPDHSAPIVAITTYFDKGSAADPVGKEGIAHFVEHMWFKSRHVDGSDIRAWDILSENGCGLNASTANDWTNYMTVCPTGSLGTLLKFASLRMTDTVKGVTEAEVESEREVIRNELRMRYENGGGESLRYIFDRVYGPDHPYHRLGIGTHDSLDNIHLADIQKFVVDNYRPENATIVVVGDFDVEDAASLIFENFAPRLLHPDLTAKDLRMVPRPGVNVRDIDPNKPDPSQVYWTYVDPNDPSRRLPLLDTPPHRNKDFGIPPTDKAYNPEVGEYDAPIADRQVIVAWSAPGGYQGNDLTIRVAANIASNQMAQGLNDDYRFVKDPETDQLQLGCSPWVMKENTTVLCFAQIKEGVDGQQAVEKMLDQLYWNSELMATPVFRASIENSIQLTRLGILQSALASLDRVAGLGGARATDIADWAHHTGSHQFHSDSMNMTGKMDFDAAVQFYQRWLTRDRAAAVILNPLPDDDLTLDNSESEYHGAGYGEDRVVSTLDPKDITEDLIRGEVDLIDFDKMVDTTLDNGMRVVIYPHGEAPWMTARIVSKGGNESDTVGMDYMSFLFRDDPRYERLPNGMLELDPLKFAGSWFDVRADAYSVLGIEAPSGNVAQALWMLRERLDGLSIDMGGSKTELNDLQTKMMKGWVKTGYWTERAVAELRGLDHPAFHMTTPEDYDARRAMSKGDLMAYLDKKYAAGKVTLVLVGNFDPDGALEDVRKYFGGYSRSGAGDITLPGPAPILEHEPRIFLFDDKRKTQTQVSLSCRMSTGEPYTDASRQVVAQMLSDYLFDELRARSGVTYGAGAGQSAQVGGTGTFGMGGLIQNSGVALAARTFSDVARDAAAGNFPLNRIGATRLNQARSYGLDEQAITDLASWLSNPVGLGLGWDYRTGFPDRLATVTLDEMKALMEPCPKTQVITMVGPVDVIRKVLDEEGLKYEVFDTEARALALYDKYSKKLARKYRKSLEEKAEKEAEDAAEKAKSGEGS